MTNFEMQWESTSDANAVFYMPVTAYAASKATYEVTIQDLRAEIALLRSVGA